MYVPEQDSPKKSQFNFMTPKNTQISLLHVSKKKKNNIRSLTHFGSAEGLKQSLGNYFKIQIFEPFEQIELF